MLAEQNGKKLDGFTPDALHMLSAYPWPGNVRELRNTVEKMVVLSRGDRLTARDVPPNIRSSLPGGDRAARGAMLPVGSLDNAERAMIEAALKRHDGNRTKAAVELGISRRTLHRKLREYAAPAEPPAEAGGAHG